MPEYNIFAVTIVVDCPACKLAVSIQNMEGSKTCPHCKTTFECDWKKKGRFESALIDQIERSIITKKANATDTVLAVSVEMLDELPCEACHEPLKLAHLETGILICEKCHNPNYVKESDQITGIHFIANGYYPEDRMSTAQEFSISCISCGGTVPINGNSRVVTCGFCSRETMVPDAIWQKIHPDAVTKPFYLLVAELEGLVKEAKSTTDVSLITSLADHFYSGVRIGLAENASLPEGVARLLLKDRNGEVVNKLRKNHSFKKWFGLQDIFADKKEAKEYTLEFPQETNPDLTEAEMMEFARQRMPKRLVALVYNPSITDEVIKQIISQKIEPAWVALAKRLDLDTEILRLLINCNHREVNQILADHPALGLQSIQRLSVSNDVQVLEKLMMNTNLPGDIRLKVKEKLDRLK